MRKPKCVLERHHGADRDQSTDRALVAHRTLSYLPKVLDGAPRRNMFAHIALLAALAVVPVSAGAQGEAKQVFRLAEQVLEDSRVQITNGTVVLASDWPTLIIAHIDRQTLLGRKQGTCTGTLIGPNVALLAAHCVDDGDLATSVEVVLDAGGVEVPLSCEMHDGYASRPPKIRSPRGQDDYALCMLLYKGDPPAGLRNLQFEVLDDSTPLRAGDSVLMTGYGCSDLRVIEDDFKFSRADGQLRIEDARLASAAADTTTATYVTVVSGQGKEPALCPGDSGGPVFTGVQVSDPRGARRVRAVNSSVDWRKVATPSLLPQYEIVSFMAPTGFYPFKNWVQGWLRSRVQKHPGYPPPVICGVNGAPASGRCRP